MPPTLLARADVVIELRRRGYAVGCCKFPTALAAMLHTEERDRLLRQLAESQ
jgi:hypothetical protein